MKGAPPRAANPGAGSAALHLARRLLHRFDDREIARAAAEVAREGLPQLVLAGIRLLAEERLDRHQEARRAEPALKRVRLVEGALERVEFAAGRKALDRPERPAVRL